MNSLNLLVVPKKRIFTLSFQVTQMWGTGGRGRECLKTVSKHKNMKSDSITQ